MRDSGRVLLHCYRSLAAVMGEAGTLTPAAEWFLDNFHVVDDTLRSIQTDLPGGFYRQLPKLADGPLRGYPRVIGLAWAFVAHTDSHFEPEALQRFVRGFQRGQPLTIGELWAMPIALRMVLVENLRRLAERIVEGRAARHDADRLANELLGLGGQPARPLAFESLAMTAMPVAFTVQLVQRLREEDPQTTPALRWLDEQLAAPGTSTDELVRAEHQAQGAMNVTVRNAITALRAMATFDWAAFVESVSLVDGALRDGSRFGAMDFATRDRYRHEIEDLARGSRRSELEVARRALARATRAAEAVPHAGDPPRTRSGDPGYYLFAQGRPVFEGEIGYRVPSRGGCCGRSSRGQHRVTSPPSAP
jgi:cyclic beta-1,2-glucan synthetase